MWPQSVGARPSSVVARGLGASGAISWLRKNGCWVKTDLVGS